MNNPESKTYPEQPADRQCRSCCDGWEQYFSPELKRELKRIGFIENDNECERNDAFLKEGVRR